MGTLNERACISEMWRKAATWKRPTVQQYDTSPALMCLGSSEQGRGASSVVVVVSMPQQKHRFRQQPLMGMMYF